MSFDYENTETPDDVVRSVAAEMSGGRLKPLSDDERLQREIWRDEQRQRDQERKAEQEYRQAVADEAARQEAAEALAEQNRVARIQLRERQRQEYEARQERQSHRNALSDLRYEAQQQGQWRNLVQSSLWQKQTQAILDDMYRMVNPPPPSPELQGLDELREEISDLKRQLGER